jgi:hypothetical protein
LYSMYRQQQIKLLSIKEEGFRISAAIVGALFSYTATLAILR